MLGMIYLLRVPGNYKVSDSLGGTKGQIKSEWIYEIINFPKNDPKNLKDFCPESFYST